MRSATTGQRNVLTHPLKRVMAECACAFTNPGLPPSWPRQSPCPPHLPPSLPANFLCSAGLLPRSPTESARRFHGFYPVAFNQNVFPFFMQQYVRKLELFSYGYILAKLYNFSSPAPIPNKRRNKQYQIQRRSKPQSRPRIQANGHGVSQYK